MANLLDVRLDIPREYLAVLRAVQEVFPQAIIAGGSLRDLHYNRPVKDVDIFILGTTDGNDIHNGIEKLKSSLGDPVKEIKGNISGEYDDLRLVHHVSKYSLDGTDYDLIFQENLVDSNEEGIENVITGFDFSICQIGNDGVSTQCTNNYWTTFTTKVVEVTNYQENRIEARLARMKAKFPEFTFDLPQAFAIDLCPDETF